MTIKDKELIVVAGGTGLSPVKGIVDYFAIIIDEAENNLIVDLNLLTIFYLKMILKIWKKNMNLTLTVDNAEEGYKGNTGLVTKFIPELEIKDIIIQHSLCWTSNDDEIYSGRNLKRGVRENILGFL